MRAFGGQLGDVVGSWQGRDRICLNRRRCRRCKLGGSFGSRAGKGAALSGNGPKGKLPPYIKPDVRFAESGFPTGFGS